MDTADTATENRSLNIGTKVMGIVGFCLTMLVAASLIGIWQMNTIGQEIEAIAERDVPLTDALSGITAHQLEQSISLERALRHGNVGVGDHSSAGLMQTEVARFTELSHLVEKEIEQARAIASSAARHAHIDTEIALFAKASKQLDELAALHVDFESQSLELVAMAEAGNIAGAEALLPAIEVHEKKLNKTLQEMLFEVSQLTVKAAKTAEHHEKQALQILIAIAVVSFVVGVSVSLVFVRRSISRPLGEVVTGIEALTGGDMSIDVPVRANDEIGAVARAYAVFKEAMIKTREMEAEQEQQAKNAEEERRQVLNEMADTFDTRVGGIIQQVSSAAVELNASARSMSSISDDTQNRAGEVAAASEQASANVSTVAAASEEMTQSIAEINIQVNEASSVSAQAVERVGKTAEQMATLADTAEKIGAVVALISDIAEQTNLLALNATIESARAGEAGKGFAVVASEVKALASETAKATEQISSEIGEIQNATQEAVRSMDDINKVIERLNQTSSAIAAAIEEQGTATQEITRNVQQAAAGTGEVTRTIVTVSETSQEAGAASSQVLAASDELAVQAETLKTEVDQLIGHIRAG